MNIISKLIKLQFEDNDTWKQDDLKRKRYMVTLPIVFPELQLVVPMQWDRGIEITGLLNLLIMPHFGWGTQVSTYV